MQWVFLALILDDAVKIQPTVKDFRILIIVTPMPHLNGGALRCGV